VSVSRRTRFLLVVLVNVVLSLGALWILRRLAPAAPSQGSYLLVLLATAVSSATPFFTAPAQLIVLELGAHLPRLPLALVAGIGSTMGELPTFWLGREGRSLGAVSRALERARGKAGWRRVERAGPWGLVAVAAIPNPLLDLVSLAAGMSGMRLAHYLPAILAGRTIRFAILATIGHRLG
jgi:membrane protein YqaA with SNARE-associated domain